MEVVHDRCCGLDVHKKSVVACVMRGEGQQTRTFGTTTRQLMKLSDWLGEQAVTHVAMESTGVYWKPIVNLLEDKFTVWVVNAHHIKTVPGSQDRRQGCRVDSRPSEARVAQAQLHTRAFPA